MYFRHYYISTSLGDGRRTRTSSKFRREAYTMGDLTLVTYIGDEREAMISSQHPKDPRAPQPPASLQVTAIIIYLVSLLDNAPNYRYLVG